MVTDGYMHDPQEVYEAWLAATQQQRGYAHGRMEVALELVGHKRLLMSAVGASLLIMEREEIVSLLDTILRNAGLSDAAEQLYDLLLEWRRPKFVSDAAVASGEPGPSGASVHAELPDATPPPGSTE